MLTLCVLPSNASCRRANHWLIENHIPFIQRNMISQPLTKSEFRHLLALTHNGVDDLISLKSKEYRNLQKTRPIEDMPLSEAIRVMEKKPQLLRRPIIFDENCFVCGFNKEEIRVFISHKERLIERQHQKWD